VLTLFWILLGYILADAISGIYHWLTDNGYNIPSQVALFQAHHQRPSGMDLDFKPAFGGLPIACIGFFDVSHMVFWATLGTAISLSQVTHYYSHHRGPWLIRLLQKLKLILPPKHHSKHHRGDYDKNFCIVSGWNNFWMNLISTEKQNVQSI